MAKPIMGTINFDWSTNIVLPLEEAHKIQAILAKHAVRVERAYGAEHNLISYLSEYEIPSVAVQKDPIEWDTRGMSKQQISKWVEMVKTVPHGGVIIDPQAFAAIHGDDDE